MAALNGQITTLNGQVAALTAAAAAAAGEDAVEDAAFAARIASLNGQITTLTAQVAGLTAAAQAAAADDATEDAAFASQIASLNGQIATFTSQVAALTAAASAAASADATEDAAYEAQIAALIAASAPGAVTPPILVEVPRGESWEDASTSATWRLPLVSTNVLPVFATVMLRGTTALSQGAVRVEADDGQPMTRRDTMTVGGVTYTSTSAAIVSVLLTRVAQLTASYGDRPNVVPRTYYESGADELIDAGTHPMLGPFEHTAVKSGPWSDPTVWSSGVVPGSLAGHAGHSVSLGMFSILYDVVSDVILKSVFGPVGSTFRLSTAKGTRMRYCTRMLMGIADLVDDDPTHLHEAVWHPVEAPGASTKLGDMLMGPTRIRGAKRKGHLRLKATGAQTVVSPAAGNQSVVGVAAGATTLELEGLSTSGWRVGDRLVVLGTEYVLPASSDPQYTGPAAYYDNRFETQRLMNSFQFGQDEQRTITAISGDVATLSAALSYPHRGTTGTLKSGKTVTRAPVIANLSRNIRFRTATAAEDGGLDPNADHTVLQKRGHLMVMRCPDVDLRYFEVRNGGRTNTDPTLWVNAAGTPSRGALRATDGGALLANPDNVRGRYAIHLHWCGGPYLSAPMINLIGASAYADVGDVPIPGWAVTQHGTRAAIEDCVISNVRGGGMVSELGHENGQWVDNVVTGCRGDGDGHRWGGRQEVYSNHNDSGGVAYGNQSRVILMRGNIAGPSKYAYLWHHQKSETAIRAVRDVDMRFADGLSKGTAGSGQFWQDENYSNSLAQIMPFVDNEAWACRVCFTVIHRMNDNYINGPDKVPMLLEGMVAINCVAPFTIPNYSNTYYISDCFFQGPLNEMASSTAFGLGTQTWDWNIFNCHLRNFRYGIQENGAHINYEGFFVDVTAENVTTLISQNYYTLPSGVDRATHAARGIMGPPQDHPTIANQLMPRLWTVLDLSDLPQPYPKAPYGRQFGPGRPVVAFGQTPYWEIGDGTNGLASAGLNLNLTAGEGRGRGHVFFTIRDCAGDRRSFDYHYTDPYPTHIGVKGGRSLLKLTPEQLVQRWGCWLDGSTWKCRSWFPGADRISHATFHYHADWTLNGFEPAFLAKHNLGGVPPEPEWPFLPEAVPAVQRPLVAPPNTLKALSRVRLESVSGQVLKHRVVVNEVTVRRTIQGGADAAHFAVSGQDLIWAGNGTKALGTPQDANGDNVYEVIIRVADNFNHVDVPHQVVVVSSDRVSPTILDTFDRANEDLEANAQWVRLTGPAGALAIRTNELAVIATAEAYYDGGSLGSSEQEVSVVFRGSNASLVLMRMVDPNNWIGCHRMDSGARFRVYMRVAGVTTLIGEFPNTSAGLGMTLRLQGRKMLVTQEGTPTNERLLRYPTNQAGGPNYNLQLLDQDTLAEPGSMLLPANAPMGTRVGLKTGAVMGGAGAATTPWLNNFSAKALAS